MHAFAAMIAGQSAPALDAQHLTFGSLPRTLLRPVVSMCVEPAANCCPPIA
jgi:hypothetical protein